MKEFVVNKNSWHYRWLVFYNYLKDYEDIIRYYNEYAIDPQRWYDKKYFQPQNFCSYWRKTIIFPFIRILFNILLTIPLIVSLTLFVYNIIKHPVSGLYFGLFIVAAFAFIFSVVVLSFLWTMIMKKFSMKVSNISDDDLLFTAYKSFKEKTCPMIRYDGDK